MPLEFKDAWILLLIPVLLAAAYFVNRRTRESRVFRFPSEELIAGVSRGWKVRFMFVPFALRLIAIALVCIALSRPRVVLDESKHVSEGIDIVLSIDTSSSMLAEDFTINGKRMNRLEVVKSVVRDFIGERSSDRIGLVAFAAEAYTVAPLTSDYDWLRANLDRLQIGLIKDGTAIGAGIASAVNRLKESSAESKIVILLTDGIHNAGQVTPEQAAQAAKSMGIKVYTIGAGAQGFAPFPVTDFFGRTRYQRVRIDLDETALKRVAEVTEASYFRATDTESLRQIYKEIDKMEKTRREEVGYRQYKELFGYFVVAALIVLALELILSHSFFMKIP